MRKHEAYIYYIPHILAYIILCRVQCFFVPFFMSCVGEILFVLINFHDRQAHVSHIRNPAVKKYPFKSMLRYYICVLCMCDVVMVCVCIVYVEEDGHITSIRVRHHVNFRPVDTYLRRKKTTNILWIIQGTYNITCNYTHYPTTFYPPTTLSTLTLNR